MFSCELLATSEEPGDKGVTFLPPVDVNACGCHIESKPAISVTKPVGFNAKSVGVVGRKGVEEHSTKGGIGC